MTGTVSFGEACNASFYWWCCCLIILTRADKMILQALCELVVPHPWRTSMVDTMDAQKYDITTSNVYSQCVMAYQIFFLKHGDNFFFHKDHYQAPRFLHKCSSLLYRGITQESWGKEGRDPAVVHKSCITVEDSMWWWLYRWSCRRCQIRGRLDVSLSRADAPLLEDTRHNCWDIFNMSKVHRSS